MKRTVIATISCMALTAGLLTVAAPALAMNKAEFVDVVVRGFHATKSDVKLSNTTSGAVETVNWTLVAGGVEVADGLGSAVGNGGDETVAIPETLDLGSVQDGETVTVNATAIETNGLGLQIGTATTTAQLHCSLNAGGDGVCTP
ncbi:hypothetical protein ACFQ08_17415 [Streptosporangium algeriense]|uniref:Uncharacterized protein n=1 Tax=Streptosporangium algeriense TaxID=1682748 RepID=A0ABW3DUF9_9ACTN